MITAVTRPISLSVRNHIRYLDGDPDVLRLTSDAPLSYVAKEVSFPLNAADKLSFSARTIRSSAASMRHRREFLDRTRDYWHGWTRNLALRLTNGSRRCPRGDHAEALTTFAETGAIVAAHTTSIPEAPGTSRNWDYRFCWLRDAYFVVDALNRLGATQIMESYIHYITTIATDLRR